jgi:peptidoglycan/LPS O-acetylase OafA/YrhL
MLNMPDFSRRIPQLDGLRGVAIAMVVAFHYVGYATQLGSPHFIKVPAVLFSLGWSGVDLFFVLSGFLIGGILLDARETTNYFSVFYRRRFCRIFPLYFAFLGVIFLVSHPSLESPWPAPWWSCATFSQNFWMAVHNQVGVTGVNITWSLAIEEQFYLALPALIYFANPCRLPRILAGGIILAPLIRLLILVADPRLTASVSVLLPCRMDSLLLGVAAAYLLRKPQAWAYIRTHRRHLWTATEILTLACALFLIRPFVTDPITMLVGYECFALLYVCILVLSLVDSRLSEVLQIKWLMSLGSVAYFVYLFHPTVFALVFMVLRRLPNGGLITAIVAVAVTVVLARGSWEWFEKPLVKLGHRTSYSNCRPRPPACIGFRRRVVLLLRPAQRRMLIEPGSR